MAKMGRPPFQPTQGQRESALTLLAAGIKHATIASLIGISVKTFMEHFREEIRDGGDAANAKIAEALYQRALAGEVAPMIFWLKTRAKWRETHHLEVSNSVNSISNLTDEQLEQIAQRALPNPNDNGTE